MKAKEHSEELKRGREEAIMLQQKYSGQNPWDYYEQELNKISQLNQTQSSLSEQIRILRIFANKLGLYDVADFLKNIIKYG